MKKLIDIKKIEKEGTQKDLILLSDKCGNNYVKLKWKCKICNYEFEKSYYKLCRDNGCPNCSSGLHEEIVRYYFEQIFTKEFKKVRPDWLKNSRNNQMELDGFCDDIAFEYQGLQHDEHIKFFHKTKEKFLERQIDDHLKIKLCKENNIKLIIIPSLIFKLKLENLKNFIIQECKKQNISLPENIESLEIDINNFKHSRCKKELEKIQKIAKSKGGECLSEVYLGWDRKLLFKCKKDHEWYATPNNIKHIKWCPVCAGKHQTIKDMRELAKTKGGKCLSEKYVKSSIHLKWECEKGHQWNAKPNNIKSGYWCPTCDDEFKRGENHPNAKHYIFISPEGEKIDVKGKIKNFCEENNLIFSSIYRRLKKDIHTHKGWTFYKVEKIITNEKQ